MISTSIFMFQKRLYLQYHDAHCKKCLFSSINEKIGIVYVYKGVIGLYHVSMATLQFISIRSSVLFWFNNDKKLCYILIKAFVIYLVRVFSTLVCNRQLFGCISKCQSYTTFWFSSLIKIDGKWLKR